MLRLWCDRANGSQLSVTLDTIRHSLGTMERLCRGPRKACLVSLASNCVALNLACHADDSQTLSYQFPTLQFPHLEKLKLIVELSEHHVQLVGHPQLTVCAGDLRILEVSNAIVHIKCPVSRLWKLSLNYDNSLTWDDIPPLVDIYNQGQLTELRLGGHAVDFISCQRPSLVLDHLQVVETHGLHRVMRWGAYL